MSFLPLIESTTAASRKEDGLVNYKLLVTALTIKDRFFHSTPAKELAKRQPAQQAKASVERCRATGFEATSKDLAAVREKSKAAGERSERKEDIAVDCGTVARSSFSQQWNSFPKCS